MRCSSCGAENAAEVRFCTSCGRSVTDWVADIVPMAAVRAKARETCPTCKQPAPKRPGAFPLTGGGGGGGKRRRAYTGWLVAGGIALAVLLTAGGAYAALSYGRELASKREVAGGKPPEAPPVATSAPGSEDPSASALGTDPALPYTPPSGSLLGSDSIGSRLPTSLGGSATGTPGTGRLTPPLGLGGGTGAGTGTERDLSKQAVVSATSVLTAAKGCTYVAPNLVDGRKETCWAEGVSGYGVGQSVTFEFPAEVTVTRIEVLPGYDKFNVVDRWFFNGRLKAATVKFGDGTTKRIDFKDEKTPQSFELGGKRTKTLTLVIADFYPARPGVHSASDTSVSEAHVFGK